MPKEGDDDGGEDGGGDDQPKGHLHDGGHPCLSSDHEDPDLYSSGCMTDHDADPDEPKPMSIVALRKLKTAIRASARNGGIAGLVDGLRLAKAREAEAGPTPGSRGSRGSKNGHAGRLAMALAGMKRGGNEDEAEPPSKGRRKRPRDPNKSY